MQDLIRYAVERFDERQQHVHAPRLHGQLALRVGLEAREEMVQFGVLLHQGGVVRDMACEWETETTTR